MAQVIDLIELKQLSMLVGRVLRKRDVCEPEEALSKVYLALSERLAREPSFARVLTSDVNATYRVIDNLVRSEGRRRRRRRRREAPLSVCSPVSWARQSTTAPDQRLRAHGEAMAVAAELRLRVEHPIHRLVLLLTITPFQVDPMDLAAAVEVSGPMIRSGRRLWTGVTREEGELEELLLKWRARLGDRQGSVPLPDEESRRALAWILRGTNGVCGRAGSDSLDAAVAWLDQQLSRGRSSFLKSRRAREVAA